MTIGSNAKENITQGIHFAGGNQLGQAQTLLLNGYLQ